MGYAYEFNTNKHSFENPWKDSKGFVPLGTYDNLTIKGVEKFDLYALEEHLGDGTELYSVALGARFSNDGPDYLSGSLDKGWQHMPIYPIHVASRRYVEYLIRRKKNGAF